MKKAVKQYIATVVFLGLFGYLFVHISYMCRPALAHTRNNLSGYYDMEKDSLDVVFIGTSETFSAYSPLQAWEEYGFASYNFSTNALCVDNMSTALREAAKTQSPKVFVIDVFPFLVSHKTDHMEEYAVRYNTDGYRYSLDRLKLILNTIPEGWDKVSFVFDIIKYHANALTWKNFFGKYPFADRGYNFLEWKGEVAQPRLNEERMPLTEEFDIWLDDVFAECEKLDAEVLFISLPIGDYQEDKVREAASVNYLQDRVEAAGYPFLNCLEFQDDFGLDYARDYSGAVHFNVYGAEKVTTLVAARLKDMYDLPDRRNDPAYAQWNQDLYAYHASVSKEKKSVDSAIAGEE